MTTDLVAEIANLETQLRQLVERHNQARVVLEETQGAIQRLQGALTFAREWHAAQNGQRAE